jgi:hypothetical protein
VPFRTDREKIATLPERPHRGSWKAPAGQPAEMIMTGPKKVVEGNDSTNRSYRAHLLTAFLCAKLVGGRTLAVRQFSLCGWEAASSQGRQAHWRGKLAASDRLFRVPALNRDKGLEIDANIKLQISQIFRSALICLCFAQLGSTYRSQQVFRVNRLCQQFEITPGVFGQIYDFSCCCLP